MRTIDTLDNPVPGLPCEGVAAAEQETSSDEQIKARRWERRLRRTEGCTHRLVQRDWRCRAR